MLIANINYSLILFPSIFALYFQGGREVNDFIKYLAKESTNPLSGYDRNGKKKKSKTEL